MSLQDDKILIRAVLNGDNTAFRVLVEQHQAKILYLGLKFFHNREEAEDFTQEVFLKTFVALSSYKQKGPFSAWLYRLAFNHAVNKYKLDKRNLLQESPVPAVDPEPVADKPGLENRLLDAEAKDVIKETVDKLPDIYQLIIKMHYFDGLDYRTISRITGIPVNTIKSHVFRAKKIIKRELSAYME